MELSDFPGAQPNPGSLKAMTERAMEERKRIPLSVPRLRMECTPIEGYHLYWAREDDVGLFIDAGYEFVAKDETRVNYRDHVAGDSQDDGNQDLGDRVKVWGGRSEDGKPYHHILMKIRLDWYEEDQRKLRNHNARILQAIFRGELVIDTGPGSETSGGDTSNRYVDQEKTSFTPGTRRESKSSAMPLFQRPVRKVT